MEATISKSQFERCSRNFFQGIRTEYSANTAHTMKMVIKETKRLVQTSSSRYFLLRCKKWNLIPQFIKIKRRTPFNNNKYDKCQSLELSYKKLENRLLRTYISQTYFTSKLINNKLDGYWCTLEERLPPEVVTEFRRYINNLFDNKTKKVRLLHIRKFKKLLHDNGGYDIVNGVKEQTHRFLINKSNIVLPEEVQVILALGPKFSCRSNNRQKLRGNMLNTVATLEDYIRQSAKLLTQNRVIEMRKILNNILTKAMWDNQGVRDLHCSEIMLLQYIKITKNFLRNNADLIVTKADKGNITVVLNKLNYEEGVMELLQDTQTYKRVTEDPTNKFQSENNKLISKLVNTNIFDKKFGQNLKIHNAIPPKIYCLPKIHKVGNKYRPIVSAINTPNCKLAKWLAGVLKPLKYKSNFYIENSFTLKDRLDQLKINTDHRFISLDVVSLFTCLPHGLIIQAIDSRWDEIRLYTEVPKDKFIELITFCLKSAYLQYKEEYYIQILGCPMGSSLSPILAELVMFYIESRIINDNPQLEVMFYVRYVDDILVILPERNIAEMFNLFNLADDHIKFTLEVEKQSRISFLDLLLIRHEDHIITDIYRKPTFSGRYLNYHSVVPKKYKVSVVNALVDRTVLLSDGRFHKKNISDVKTILQKNCYPRRFVEYYIRKRLVRWSTQRDKSYRLPPNNEPRRYLSVTFFPETFYRIKYLFKDLPVVLCPVGAVSLHSECFSKLKAKTEKVNQSNLVYSVECNVCKKVYIGETTQYLKKRLYQHQYNVRYNNGGHSALTAHLLETHHSANYSDVKVLHYQERRNTRLLIENMFISINDNALNCQLNLDNLSLVYNDVLKML